MKRFELRLDDELHTRLVELAEREHRSLHAQIIHLVEQGTREEDDSLGEYRRRTEQHRRRIAADGGPYIG